MTQQVKDSLSNHCSPPEGRNLKAIALMNKITPYPAVFVEDHIGNASKSEIIFDNNWLAKLNKTTQPAMSAEHCNTSQALNGGESTNNYLKENLVAQLLQNEAKANGADMQEKIQF